VLAASEMGKAGESGIRGSPDLADLYADVVVAAIHRE